MGGKESKLGGEGTTQSSNADSRNPSGGPERFTVPRPKPLPGMGSGDGAGAGPQPIRTPGSPSRDGGYRPAMREKASSVPTHFMHTFVPMAPKPQPKEGAVAPPEFLLGEAGGAGSKRQAIWAQYCMAEEEIQNVSKRPMVDMGWSSSAPAAFAMSELRMPLRKMETLHSADNLASMDAAGNRDDDDLAAAGGTAAAQPRSGPSSLAEARVSLGGLSSAPVGAAPPPMPQQQQPLPGASAPELVGACVTLPEDGEDVLDPVMTAGVQDLRVSNPHAAHHSAAGSSGTSSGGGGSSGGNMRPPSHPGQSSATPIGSGGGGGGGGIFGTAIPMKNSFDSRKNSMSGSMGMNSINGMSNTPGSFTILSVLQDKEKGKNADDSSSLPGGAGGLPKPGGMPSPFGARRESDSTSNHQARSTTNDWGEDEGTPAAGNGDEDEEDMFGPFDEP